MSRAFVREPDGDQVGDDQPEIPVSPHPNYVTPAGFAALERALQQRRGRRGELRDADGVADKSELAQLAREIRYYEARRASAILIPSARQPRARVGFGALVEFEDESGARLRYRIVGEDEAAPERGSISHVSPLARAAIGAECGDVLTWARPSGDLELEVVAISYPD